MISIGSGSVDGDGDGDGDCIHKVKTGRRRLLSMSLQSLRRGIRFASPSQSSTGKSVRLRPSYGSTAFQAQWRQQPARPRAAQKSWFSSSAAGARASAHTLPASRRAPRSSRVIRNAVYTLCFASIGWTVGNWLNANFLGGVTDPGSPEDVDCLARLETACDRLPLVKRLRADPAEWEEWQPYSNFSEEEKRGRLTSGCLSGSRALGFQRVFWSEKQQKAICIIHPGNAVTGWPGVVHGGLQATILDEALARAAIRFFPERTGVTANLNVDYKKPMLHNQFYKVVVDLDKERSSGKKAFIRGRIEDMGGNLYTEAQALFVVPKTLQLRKLEEKF
ncbi:hypothetical protein KEM52_005185 [Ascosphaera acerosa]|nr:hypothetical protein KEM52_005185 [Ascosphaera acerosa]